MKSSELVLYNCSLVWKRKGEVVRGPAWIEIQGSKIQRIGTGVPPKANKAFDCQGRAAIPGLVECHTHSIFAGNRAVELEMRARGVPYEEIAKMGGGILSTVSATKQASDEELEQLLESRLDTFVAHGVTTVEVKSGYELDVEGELRLLTIIQRVAKRHPVRVHPTLLAHMVPPWIKKRDRYVNEISRELIPEVARQGLAHSFDVFVERIAFSLEEAKTMMEAALKAGLQLRVHAEQLSHSGASSLAASLGARSADHLDFATGQDITQMAKNNTIAVLLPGCVLARAATSFVDARKFINAGVDVALSTDFNPGSSPSMNLALMGALGVAYMGLGYDEAMAGITHVPARVLGSEAGVIQEGSPADVVVLDTSDYRDVFYHIGTNHVWKVFIGGREVHESNGSGGYGGTQR